MRSVASAVEAVERLERDLESLNAQWSNALEILIPFVGNDTIDAMSAAMSARSSRWRRFSPVSRRYGAPRAWSSSSRAASPTLRTAREP